MTLTKTKEIPLKPSKSSRRSAAQGYAHYMVWTRALPFAVNPRGVLAHRVQHVDTILYGDTEHHHHIHYLCGNGCNFELGVEDDVLVAGPPEDRLLCERCEEVARRKELPTGDALAGRHVHVGVLVPKQTCCNHTEGEP